MAIENGEQLLAMMRGFQVSCVLSAGADLDVFNLLSAEPLIREVNPGGVHCVLDVGDGPGIWTLSWLETDPAMRAILFDLPEVIPLASIHLTQWGVAERVELVSGNFYVDPMPRGADLVWVSAIIHQNSREENRTLYVAVCLPLNAMMGWNASSACRAPLKAPCQYLRAIFAKQGWERLDRGVTSGYDH